ncbi:FGGY-family carbohydrate kinase, partial [Metallibacterium scheffleri]|uniref:FGGY-family carbohydrate kinase n=1 Tax=Metallibacterium scheffleri TaxID=993689 RepID=UPI0023F14858
LRLPHIRRVAPEVLATARSQRWEPAEVLRALLAAEADGRCHVGSLRVDGGMSANQVFLQELADAIGRPVEASIEVEATTLGAGILAGLACGTWASPDAVAADWRPRATVLPTLDPEHVAARRARWLDARARAERTVPELSGISF